MNRHPPGILGVAWKLARMALARRLNRWSSRRRAGGDQGRRAVARKRTGLPLLVLVLGPVMLFQAFSMSNLIVRHYERGVERDAREAGEFRSSLKEVLSEELRAEIQEEHPDLVGPCDSEDDYFVWWPSPEEPTIRVCRALSLLLTVLFFTIFFLHLSGGNRDLGRPGWDMEWFFSFPVPTQGLFLARIGEYILSDLWTWLIFWPFLSVFYWHAGYYAFGLLLALPATLAVAALQAALRVAAETWLRKHLARSSLGNVQATATILGLLGLFGVFALGMHPPDRLFTLSQHVPTAVLGFAWLSAVLPMVSGWAVFVPLVWGFLGVVGALVLAAGMVRDGLLVAGGGPYQGRRGRDVARPRAGVPRRRLRGLAGKEVRLLLRDRNLLVQTLVLPILLIGINLLANPGLRGGGNPDTAVLIAYGVGAYVLMFGAFGVLVVERKSLWLLFTFPRSLGALLRQKVFLWGAAGTAYALVVLGIMWRPDSTIGLHSVLRPFLALAGIWMLAHVAAGLGVLGADPFSQTDRRRVKPQWVYAYAMVAAGLGLAIAGDSLWTAFVSLGLTASLAWAVWQKADDRLPVLLDPVTRPMLRLSLADGLIAVFAFFLLQSVLVLLFALAARPALALALGYTVAGAVVFVVTWRRIAGIQGVWEALGLARGAPPRALLLGFVVGVVAGAVGLLWLAVVDLVEPLRSIRDATPQLLHGGAGDAAWALVALVVLAAPLVEEWLFRGLVYGGMRRSRGVLRAALTSALLFAIVHPAIAFPAVFCLGVAAALVRERSGVLWAAMLTHATYNAIVVLADIVQL